MHRLHRLDERILQEAVAVVGAPHQTLHDAGDPHRGDVEHDADGRDPEVHHHQLERIEPGRAPQFRHQVIDRAEADERDPAQRAGMNVADGPVGEVGKRIDRLDRHRRPFERAHAVEGDRGDQEPQHRIGAQLMPRARERHDAVDHAAPGRHPQDQREGHAEGLQPVGCRRIMQVVRTGPDIEEDQRPEMDDRKTIRINRPFRLLGHEVVHDAEEPGGQEEADRVVAVPPLCHGVLHARPDPVALGSRPAHRHGEVVDDVQNRDRQDKGEIEPVGDVNVPLAPLEQRARERDQVGDPHDGQQQVHVPFGFGVFLALGDAEDVPGRRQHDHQLVAPEDEVGEPRPAEQRRAAGALHDVKRRGEQGAAAEGENRGRGVDRTEPAEGGPFEIEIENRKRQLQRDDDADRERRHAPENRGDGEFAHDIVVVGNRRRGGVWTCRHVLSSPPTFYCILRAPADQLRGIARGVLAT